MAEIDLAAFDRNVAALASLLRRGRSGGQLRRTRMAMEPSSWRAMQARHVAMIGVALLEEALELRRAGITLPSSASWWAAE